MVVSSTSSGGGEEGCCREKRSGSRERRASSSILTQEDKQKNKQIKRKGRFLRVLRQRRCHPNISCLMIFSSSISGETQGTLIVVVVALIAARPEAPRNNANYARAQLGNPCATVHIPTSHGSAPRPSSSIVIIAALTGSPSTLKTYTHGHHVSRKRIHVAEDDWDVCSSHSLYDKNTSY